MQPPPSPPSGSVLIDYYAYSRSPTERGLAAFVSRTNSTHRDQPVVYRDLGPLDPVEAAALRWRMEIPCAASRTRCAAATLRKLVWEPLVPLLDGADTALISPDGVLAALPFAALPGSKAGTYLIEEYALATVPVPRLLSPAKSLTESLARRDGEVYWSVGLPPAVQPTPLLVGGVNFSEHPAIPADRPPRPGLRFAALPGTANEVCEIDRIFQANFANQKSVMLTGTPPRKRRCEPRLPIIGGCTSPVTAISPRKLRGFRNCGPR